MNFSEQINKVLFISQINKIKNTSVKKYFTEFFKLKTILLKILFLVALAIFVVSISFGVRNNYLAYWPNKVVLNSGVSFSFLKDASPAVIYFIQIFPCVLSFIAFIFVNKWYIYFGLLLLSLGGLCNIIDRAIVDYLPNANGDILAHYHTVVDYLPLPNSTCNVPDIFIVMGSCFTVLGFGVQLYIMMKIESKKISHDNK